MRTPARVLTAVLVGVTAASAPVLAFVGFATVAERQDVSVTIYNSADLTLVKDRRAVVLKKGVNPMRFEWSGTLIDPTSLLAFPPPGVKVLNTTYPLDHGESLVWELQAAEQVGGPMSVQYFTSGLTWAGDHLVTLTGGGRASVETWITVTNSSGEEYRDARFRLVVGEVRLVERIAEIAQRFKQEARGYAPQAPAQEMMREFAEDEAMPAAAPASLSKASGGAMRASRPKAVERESLSELHLYSIEGTESVPNAGARRMRAFSYRDVAVKDVYRCVNPSGRVPAQRVLSFKNTRENRMGTQPLPEGRLLLFRATRDGNAFDGNGQLPYTPMGEEAEAPVGSTPGVTCEAYVKSFARKVVDKDALGRTLGWEDITEWELTLVNGAAEPATFEVRQSHEAPATVTLKSAKAENTTTLVVREDLDGFGRKVLRYAISVKRGTLAEKKGR
ncbi:MAG: hypothetical protein HY904_15715 [Deltaproteobacteria bacterium]|nr:hypothetical protein [Deltaproteobacteria bacterium]